MTPEDRQAVLAMKVLAALLLAGAVMVLGAGLTHPVLRGSSTAQLEIIASTGHWRLIHLSLLAGTTLVVMGVWSQPFRYSEGAALALLRPALLVLCLGLTVNALNIVFMTGAGHLMAQLHAKGEPSMGLLFEATHPIGLMSARFGNFLVAMAAGFIGWAARLESVDPRWVGWLAWLASGVGIGGVIVGHESTPYILLPTVLLIPWLVAVAVRTLAR